MDAFLTAGSIAGLLLGLMHAVYIARRIAPAELAAGRSPWPATLHYSAWTLVLWFLLGAYLLGFWLLACAFWVIFKALR